MNAGITRRGGLGLAVLLVTLPLAPAHADYALAFGRKGSAWAYGTSSNAASINDAKREALESCDLKGCKVVNSGRDLCVALAISAKGAAAWSTSGDLHAARESALVTCSELDRRCTIAASFCDRPPAPRSVPQPTSPPPAPQPAPTAAPPSPWLTPTAPAPAPAPTLTFTQALKSKLRSCISLSGGSFGADDTARLVFSLNEAGKLASAPTVAAVGSGSNAGVFVTKLVVALDRCAPYGSLPGAAQVTRNSTSIDFAPADFR